MTRLMVALAMFLPASVLAAGLAHANPGDVTMAESTTVVTNEDVMDELKEMRALMGLSTQVAIIMVVPYRCVTDGGRPRCFVYTYLLGSTIDNFPAGTVNATTGRFDNRTLPQGKYLIETHPPRSANPLCHSNASAAPMLETGHSNLSTASWFRHCAQLIIGTHGLRLDAGSRIYTVGTEGFDFRPIIYFPRSWVDASTTDTSKYRVHTGSIKITKLR